MIVRKKDNSIRLCADLRTLNKNILVDCHPLPKISDLLSNINKAKLFSLLDLRSAYHQIPLAAESQDLTTFITPFGAYKFLRLPFGLASAASVFQKFMDSIHSGISGTQAYQDDVLIFSETREGHISILRKVLRTFNKVEITLKLDKCKMCKTELDYLDHCISDTGIHPKFSLVKVI